MEQLKIEQLGLKVTNNERRILETASSLIGLATSPFIRSIALEKARQILRDNNYDLEEGLVLDG